MTKLIIPFNDDPMGHSPGTGGTAEQVEAARKAILEAEDERILAEMRRVAYPDGTPEEHARTRKSRENA